MKAGTATFLVDEPKDVGGLGSGPNPYDLLSAALGSCTLMTVRQYADLKKWPSIHAYHAKIQERPNVARAFSEELALYREELARQNAPAPAVTVAVR